MKTWELMRMAVPTREEKRRLARTLGLSEGLIYRWTEDPYKSGQASTLDRTDVVLDHARLHHPEVAIAITQHFQAGNDRALGRRAAELSESQLLTALHPQTEAETLEAVRAFSGALRELVLHDDADLDELLREVEEAERQLRMAAVMIRAVRDEQRKLEG